MSSIGHWGLTRTTRPLQGKVIFPLEGDPLGCSNWVHEQTTEGWLDCPSSRKATGAVSLHRGSYEKPLTKDASTPVRSTYTVTRHKSICADQADLAQRTAYISTGLIKCLFLRASQPCTMLKEMAHAQVESAPSAVVVVIQDPAHSGRMSNTGRLIGTIRKDY